MRYIVATKAFPLGTEVSYMVYDTQNSAYIADCDVRSDADKIADALNASPSEASGEYICKCGVRVVPHRCPTGQDF